MPLPLLANMSTDHEASSFGLAEAVNGQMEIPLETSLPDWATLAVLHRNTLPPRADFMLFNSEDAALSRDSSRAKLHSLSGTWVFHLANSPFEAPPDFAEVGFDSSTWDEIQVPGMWQLQGFGKGPQYTNIQYPFPVDPPYPPFTENECGSYRTRFKVPQELEGHQLRLRFEGVDSSFHVWVNGKEVGYSQGSRNPSEFDVTDYVKQGETNVLAVRVYQFCTGSYIEDQDQWWLSGIFRDVHLLGFPAKVHLNDLRIRTTFDSEYRDANLEVTIALSAPAKVKLKLLDAAHVAVTTTSVHISSGSTPSATVSTKIRQPKHWTAEIPYLYNLVLCINDEQFMCQRIGFRQVEIKDGLLKVNGKRIVIKGVNRHEHHPKSGRTVPLEFLRRDLHLMKQHNINAIRTCHQPNDPRLYDLADELGFWVMDEADLECHGFGLISGNPARWTSNNDEWRESYLDRAKQLVHRDHLHPCVIIWSLGNEAFYGKNHTAMVEWIKSYDPTRPIHYEPDDRADHVDLYSRMYASVDDIVSFAENASTKDKPLVLCEYMHAMGTGPGAIKEYVDAFYKYPRLQGGWAWEWANHGLLTKNKDGTEYYGYGGDFGDTPNDGHFVMDGLLQSDHTPNSGLIEYKKALEPVQVISHTPETVTIINRLDSATLDHISCTWSLVEPTGSYNSKGIMAIPLGIMPGCTAELRVPHINTKLPADSFLDLSFKLKENTAWAEAGYELAFAQIPLTKPSSVTRLPNPLAVTLTTKKDGTWVRIFADDCSWAVDTVRGTLSSWIKDDVELITRPLEPTFYRAPTDNDAPQDGKEWKACFLHLAHIDTWNVKCHTTPSKDKVIVTMTQNFAPPVLSWSIGLITTYTFYPSGTLQLHVAGHPRGLKLPSTLPRIGVTLGLAPTFTQTEWFGRGPGESYRDFKLSQRIGQHQATVDDLWTNPEYPQECSNRTDTSILHISDPSAVDGRQLTAQFYDPAEPAERRNFDFMACRYSVQDIERAQHPFELEETEGVVWLRLDAEHHGLGTGSCGPKTLEKYELRTRPFEFGVVLY